MIIGKGPFAGELKLVGHPATGGRRGFEMVGEVIILVGRELPVEDRTKLRQARARAGRDAGVLPAAAPSAAVPMNAG